MIKGDAIWERLKERNESKVNKSVYSLVLADDVVEAIDRLAFHEYQPFKSDKSDFGRACSASHP